MLLQKVINMSKLKSHNFGCVYDFFVILIISHNRRSDISMRKDITIEKMMLGEEKITLEKIAICTGLTIDEINNL